MKRREFLLGSAASGISSLMPLTRALAGQAGTGSTAPAATAAGQAAPASASADSALYALLEKLSKTPEADETPDGAGRQRQFLIDRHATLSAFDPQPLSFDARLDYDSVLWGTSMEAASARQFDYGAVGGSSPYVIGIRSGSWQKLDEHLSKFAGADVKAEARKAAYRAAVVDLDGEAQRVRIDAKHGVIPPDFAIDAMVKKLGAMQASVAAMPDADAVAAALGRQAATLQELRALASSAAGLWHLPDGDAYYEQALRWTTGLNDSAENAFQTGLRLAEELNARADPLLRALGLTQGAVGERLRALAEQPQYLYPDTSAGRDAAVEDMNATLFLTQQMVPELFHRWPAASLAVRRMTPDDERAGRQGYRVEPSFDASKPGYYYVDLSHIRDRPSWTLPTVVHHELLPGHLLQAAMAAANPPNPMRHRYRTNGFNEGWALYAQQLIDQQGFFQGSEISQLGYLQSMLWRTARLVADTGLQVRRWTHEEAVAQAAKISGEVPWEIEDEVLRYCMQPAAVGGCTMGLIGFRRLLDQARAVAGTGFDLADFHDSVLSRGGYPLPVLARSVMRDLGSGH